MRTVPTGFPSGAASLVAYSVHFVVDLASVPEAARLEIKKTLDQVAEAVSTIDPSNAFWSSIHSSQLQIDTAGYRLVYRILRRSREIHVVEIASLRRR